MTWFCPIVVALGQDALFDADSEEEEKEEETGEEEEEARFS